MIRIVGTHNTANEVFHCVHFEAPAVTNVMRIEDKSDLSVDEEDEENEDANVQNESKDVEAGLDDGDNAGQVNSMQDFEANFNEAKDDAFSHVSIHSSPSSNAGSVSAGQSGIPMGASACSMARASSGLRQSSMQMSSRDSPSSSPVLFEAAPVGGGSSVSRSSNYPRHHGGSAPSLPVAQSVTNSPVRAVSVDEAASLALANLLEIDETQSNGGQGGTSSTLSAAAASATRRYQHALSVRVPPNQHGNGNTTATNPPGGPSTPAASVPAASSSNGTAASSGAVPRRQSRSSSARSQNQSEES